MTGPCLACVHRVGCPLALNDVFAGSGIEIARDRMLGRDKVLFREGSRCRSLYFLRSGSLMSVVESQGGESQVVMYHLPGEIVGVDLPDLRQEHTVSVIALEPSLVCELSYGNHATRLPASGALQERLMQQIDRQALLLQTHVQMIGRPQAQQRVAMFLADLSERYRRLQRDPCTLRLTMPRSALASYLALAPETVSRMFGQLRDAGIIDMDQRTVRIKDPAALSAAAYDSRTPGRLKHGLIGRAENETNAA